MKKRFVGLFAVMAIFGLLTGCGKNEAPAPTPASQNTPVQQVTANETQVAKQYNFTVLGVQDEKQVILVKIDGPKDDQMFHRVGVALGAIGNVNLTDVTTVAVEYSVGKKPLLAVSLPYKTLEDYRAHKITQDDMAKQMKVGLATPSTTK